MKKIIAIALVLAAVLSFGTAYAQQQTAPQNPTPQTGMMMHCPMMAGMQQGGTMQGGMMHCPMMKMMHSGHQTGQATPPAAPSKP